LKQLRFSAIVVRYRRTHYGYGRRTRIDVPSRCSPRIRSRSLMTCFRSLSSVCCSWTCNVHPPAHQSTVK